MKYADLPGFCTASSFHLLPELSCSGHLIALLGNTPNCSLFIL